MAFKRFRTKIVDDQLDPSDLLLHAVDMLDEATLQAFKTGNEETLITIYDKYIDASDRLMGLAAAGWESEEKNERPKSEPVGFKLDKTTQINSSP